MAPMKQPAISKHPNGTASFYLRVVTETGLRWECCAEKPRPIAEVIKSLETEYLGMMRKLDKRKAVDAVDPVAANQEGPSTRENASAPPSPVTQE